MAVVDQRNAAYIRERVRSGDRDRYWAALFAPEPARRDLLALYAFHLELAHLPEQVREPQLGEIRLEWWRTALDAALKGEPAEHPVLEALARAVSGQAGAPSVLEGMIEARRFDLFREPMADEAALRAYLLPTAGAVFQLGARITHAPEAAERACEHAAIAYGLTGLMRALPHHTARGQIFLPGDLLARHGVHPQTILSGEASQDLRAVLRELRERAEDALARARHSLNTLPRTALPAFLPLALVPAYLRQLAKPGHHPLRDLVQLNPLVRFGLIWRAAARGRI